MLGVVESGHNVFIMGQAGTGKSFLIGKIFQTLKRRGEKVVIVCSSGIATTVHDDLGTYVRTVTVPPNGFQKSFSGASRWWMRLTISKILLLDIDSSSQIMLEATFTLSQTRLFAKAWSTTRSLGRSAV